MKKTLSKWWHVFFGIEVPPDELPEDTYDGEHWEAYWNAYWDGFKEGQRSLWPLVKVLIGRSKD